MTDPAQEPQGGYAPEYFSALFAVEDRHFWFRSRNIVVSAVVGQAVAALSPGYRVLEMGCGDGNVLRFLERACPQGLVVGMDLFAEGLRYARTRTACPLVQGDVRKSPFGRRFQLIGVFDVLEHLPDDRAILRDLYNLLDDNGTLVITVPARQHLWSYFDDLAGHCRRYELDELRQRLVDSGYTIAFLTPFMSVLHPILWISRKLRARAAKSSTPEELLKGELRMVPIVNQVLCWILFLEARWLAKRRTLPLGTSLIAVARKQLPLR